jgi:hypothetical protein
MVMNARALDAYFSGKIAKAEAAISATADMRLCEIHRSFGGFVHGLLSLATGR